MFKFGGISIKGNWIWKICKCKNSTKNRYCIPQLQGHKSIVMQTHSAAIWRKRRGKKEADLWYGTGCIGVIILSYDKDFITFLENILIIWIYYYLPTICSNLDSTRNCIWERNKYVLKTKTIQLRPPFNVKLRVFKPQNILPYLPKTKTTMITKINQNRKFQFWTTNISLCQSELISNTRQS